MRSRSASRPPAGDHRQAGEPGRELHVALGVHPPALAVIDRAHRLLRLVEGVERGVDGDRVAGPDQPLAVLDPLGHRLPVARLLGQARQVSGEAGAGLLGRARGLEKGLLARRLVAGHHGEAGQHRRARLEEVAVEIADQRVAAPARPDLREGDGREHADGNVLAVRVVEGEACRRHGERAARRGALLVQRIARRPAPGRAFGLPVAISGDVGRGEFRRQRQEPVRLQPPRAGARRGERAFERPAERAERGLRRGARTAGEAGGDEHPVIRKREGRPAPVQPAPAAGGEQVAPLRAHPGQCAPGIPARLGPGPARRAEARARPVNHLDGAALGRGVGQRAGERAKGLAVDAGEGRQLDSEAGAGGIDVELARLVEGAPGQQRVQRGRHGGRRPGTRRLLPLEEFEQTPDDGSCRRRTHFSLQPAGSSTTRTCDASR